MKQKQSVTMENIYLALIGNDEANPASEYPIRGRLVGLNSSQLSQLQSEEALDESIKAMMERVDTVIYLSKILDWTES